MNSLADALARGQGPERPFRCEKHNDSQASASVNVFKGVWYCYACHAKGRVDAKSKKALEIADLQAMLDPEGTARIYADAYLDMFDNDLGNWPTRFPGWLRWSCRLGCDPLTGDATFPVRTPKGQLAGVGRRTANPSPTEPRFRYPPRWSASRSMFTAGEQHKVLSLTEGASDAAAIAETGAFAAACYGAGVHAPQLELIAQLSPKLVILAFDADEAGQRATAEAKELLAGTYEVGVVDWGRLRVKDAAAATPSARLGLISQTVGASFYGANKPDFSADMTVRAVRVQAAYSEERSGSF